MAEFHGTVELIAGITPKNGGDFALVGAHDVQIDNDGNRLDTEFSNLKSAFNEDISIGRYGQKSYSSIEQGTYNRYGDTVESSTRIRTVGFCRVSNGDVLHFTPGANTQQFLFGSFSIIGEYESDSAWVSRKTDIVFDKDALIICVFRKTGNADITPEEYDAELAIESHINTLISNITDEIDTEIVDRETAVSNVLNTIDEVTGVLVTTQMVSGNSIDIFDAWYPDPVNITTSDVTATIYVSGNMFPKLNQIDVTSNGIHVWTDPDTGTIHVKGTATAGGIIQIPFVNQLNVQDGTYLHIGNSEIVNGAVVAYTSSGVVSGSSIALNSVNRIIQLSSGGVWVDKALTKIGISTNNGAIVDYTLQPMLLWTPDDIEWMDYYPEESFLNPIDVVLKKGYNHLRASSGNITLEYSKLGINYEKDETIITRNNDIMPLLNGASIYSHNGNGAENIDKLFTMLMVTDTHGDKERTQNAVLYGNTMPQIDAIIHLGDIVGSNFQSPYAWFEEVVQTAEKPFYICLGNHDGGDVAIDTAKGATVQQQFDRFLLPNRNKIGLSDLSTPYYAINNSTYGITLICLDCYDLPDTLENGEFVVRRNTPGYSQAQIDWLVNVLTNIPQNNHLIIAQHCIFEAVTPDNNEWKNPKWNYVAAPSVIQAYDYPGMIMEIIEAWKEGTTLSKTYSSTTNGMPNLNVNANFSSRGNGVFVGYIIGHTHWDQTGVITAFPSQHYYNFDTTANDLFQNKWSDLPRQVGTKCEDCITTISIDKTKRTVKLVRIGSNYTFDLTKREKTVIQY